MMNYNGAANILFSIADGPSLSYSTLLLLTMVPHLVTSSFSSEEIDEPAAPTTFVSPFVLPATEKQIGTIIFLHSHGQRGHLWKSELEKIRQPYLKIVCPTANEWPVNYHNNIIIHSWYDFHGDEIPELNEDAKGMNASTAYIHDLIEEEIKNGVPPEHIIVAGYCQGGPLALYAGLSFPKRLGGIATFSSFNPTKRTFNETFNNVNKDIPILHCYLHRAPYSNEGISNNTVNILKTMITKNSVYKMYPYTHGQKYIVEKEWEDMKDFCAGIIKKK